MDDEDVNKTRDPNKEIIVFRREVRRQLASYRRRRRRDKRKSFYLQLSTVFLSATITVLLGLQTSGSTRQDLSNVALSLGALVTVLAAAESFFAHRGLWMLRTETVRRLETLDRHLDYYESHADSSLGNEGAIRHYEAQLDRILAEDHSSWQQIRNASIAPLGQSEVPLAEPFSVHAVSEQESPRLAPGAKEQ
jgi:hypothetical protein